MFDLNGTFSSVKVDVTGYKKNIDENMQVQIRQAARAWLRAVILKVPVYTGTSRGSLKPLGAFLKVAVPINPVASRPKQGPSVGASQSEFDFLRQGDVWSFQFDLEVAQYIINEYYDVSGYIQLRTPGPYNSFKAGENAFQNYIEQNLASRIPALDDFITTSNRVLY